MHPPPNPYPPPSSMPDSPYARSDYGADSLRLKPNFKLYGLQAVGIATFLGAFLGGGWIMGKNSRRLGKPGWGWMFLLGGAAANATLFWAINAVPWISKLPNFTLFIPQLLIMSGLFTALQKDAYEHHVEGGGAEGSSWAAPGVGLIAAALSFVIAMGVFSQQNDLFNLGYNTRRYDQNNAIHFTDDVDTETVKLLRHVFKREGLFTAESAVEVRVSRNDGKYVLAIPFSDGLWNDPGVEQEAQRLATGIGGTMLGFPFTINLCDDVWAVQKPIVVTAMPPSGLDFQPVIDPTGY